MITEIPYLVRCGSDGYCGRRDSSVNTKKIVPKNENDNFKYSN